MASIIMTVELPDPAPEPAPSMFVEVRPDIQEVRVSKPITVVVPEPTTVRTVIQPTVVDIHTPVEEVETRQ